ncbi:MAG TPA: hypothetical protein V6C85_16915 [Allocoleopsis sp.]
MTRPKRDRFLEKPGLGGRSASPTPPAQGLIGVMAFLKSVTFSI